MTAIEAAYRLALVMAVIAIGVWFVCEARAPAKITYHNGLFCWERMLRGGLWPGLVDGPAAGVSAKLG